VSELLHTLIGSVLTAPTSTGIVKLTLKELQVGIKFPVLCNGAIYNALNWHHCVVAIPTVIFTSSKQQIINHNDSEYMCRG
jgi:hypothetical protein